MGACDTQAACPCLGGQSRCLCFLCPDRQECLEPGLAKCASIDHRSFAPQCFKKLALVLGAGMLHACNTHPRPLQCAPRRAQPSSAAERSIGSGVRGWQACLALPLLLLLRRLLQLLVGGRQVCQGRR